MLPRLKILFLCTRNSCRSQMAEGWARALHAERIDAYSAGTTPGSIDPRAVRVMRESGIDLATQRSKSLDELSDLEFDLVVSVCDRAKEACPTFPGALHRLHVSFDDPPRLAAEAKTEEERLAHYRRIRDEIGAFVKTLPAMLAADAILEPARAHDLPDVLRLVEASALPTAGLAEAFPGGYAVVRRGGGIAGVAGLEPYGAVALLRSVAIASSERGKGLGRRLVEDRLARAQADRLQAVYLLTTTAAAFFRELGFETTSRDDVPAELRQSAEFASICPASAVCMVKRLG